jgi:hypothetical protein
VAGLILVRCRRPGFRRAGLAHPARAEYPAGFFTSEQLAQLRAEPMLDVQMVGDQTAPSAEQATPAEAATGDTPARAASAPRKKS